MKYLLAFLAVVAVAHGFVPKLDGRIVGGHASEIEDFPYQVSVRIYDQHICGGSIIDSNTILTAAHCVDGMDHTQYSVRVGNTYHNYGWSFRVSAVRMNQAYDPKAYDNDVAILKLAVSINVNNAVAVSLQPRGQEVQAGTTAYVSGWGVTQEGSEDVPEGLRSVDVAVITNNECERKYGGGGLITSHMMCAQTFNQDSCQGDSGGPLVANGRLIGIVSWGYGCAQPQFPGVYAKVSSDLFNWIAINRV